jgi:farnesyl-diphosphate farnesyltransferase
VVPLLKSLPKNYQKPVCDVVIEMCGGMAKFALRQEAALSAGWFTLANVGELDEYCYYVAGIVGKLLTKLFSADTCFINAEREAELSKLDVSFGLALQVVNIVKDCVEDSGRRVCFIPEEICKRHGFAHPSELFAAGADAQKCGAVLAELVEKAWHHLDDAIAYTKLIPNIKMRTRLFCLWPLFMAAENLSLIGDGVSVFTSDKKVKITRDTVKRIVKETSMHFYSDKWIDEAYKKIKG